MQNISYFYLKNCLKDNKTANISAKNMAYFLEKL